MFSRQEDQIMDILREKMSDFDAEELFAKINDILSDMNINDTSKLKNFSVGDTVIILEDKNPIISYDGNPEGFSADLVGQQGVIIKFDTKTMSQKNVFVQINGEVFAGHISKIKKVM